MYLHDDDGNLIDAELSLDRSESESCVVVESGGGRIPAQGILGRNPDYDKLLTLLFRRLAQSRTSITRVVLDSGPVQDLPETEREASLTTPYPVDLAAVDVETFRKELQRCVATMHRVPNAQGGGNRQRRIRVYLNRRIEPRELRAATESVPEVLEEQFPPSVLETERDQLRRARVGQGKFREQLLERYDGECPITGIREHELLIASHIKPWSVSSNAERLSTDNGILLSALVDRLFDKNLISFSDDGGVLISPRLSDYDRVKCGTAHWAAIQVFSGQEPYLRYHRHVWADLNAH